MLNRDPAPTYDPGPSFLIENSPDYPRAVEELYCASMAAGSDRRSFAADVVAIADRYGFEGDQPQTLLLDVVMELVSFVRSALSLEARSVLEEVVAERAMIARLADDLENFEDGDR
ncbi:hypothetical protein C5B93_01100 [Rathayibacter sp. AY1A2]|uniref:hypothetical protein n=1 Tax=Rathayibacter sp. AY1A2 TaxID=2080520 RepID=UPI000CE91468|nr:hypothetical protein [Rathayibacter sp. AY1A2]PPF41339.1 hypothetical protein C5B93_01100 [Rathayibacter sp. AY1A2]